MEIQATDYLLPLDKPSIRSLTEGNTGAGAAKLKKSTEDFEAVFLKQFLGQALKPLLHKTLGSQAAGAGVYQHMITDVIAENLASGGDFGFSSMLRAQLMQSSETEVIEQTRTSEDKKGD